MKPLSCHLYPIRLQPLSGGRFGVNYHRWPVCKDAFECGQKLDLPVYKFLKEPLIRAFGQEWYDKLLEAAKWLEENAESVHGRK